MPSSHHLSQLPRADPAAVAARAVGRTAAEHAAVEERLAIRRAYRLEPEVARRRTDAARRQWQQQQLHHEGKQLQQNALLAAQPRALSPSPSQEHSPPQAGRAPAPARWSAAQPRPRKTRLSSRKARGAGWHKRGYRDLGGMWINVKAGGAVRGMDVNENATLKEFVRQVEDSQASGDYAPHKQGWSHDLFFRKKSLLTRLEENKAQGLEEHEVLVRHLFDGGETVYYKIYDEHGNLH